MKNFRKSFLLSIIIFLVLIVGVLFYYHKIGFKYREKDDDLVNIQKLKEQLSLMSLREKIAQMLVVYNNKLTDEFIEEIHNNQVGGFIVFSDNISTFSKTKQLISNIQLNSKIPMIMAIDQEGGRVQRLLSVTDKRATDIMAMQRVGEINNLDLSYGIGTIIGEEVRSLGINTVFAPVLDVGDYQVSSMKDRLLSDKASIVARNALMIGKGIYDSGVIPCYKHFPGIANTTVDSHDALPVIMKTKTELYQEELIPFIEAIKSGASMIMVGHVSYPLITNSNIPSSLSKEISDDLLRQELKYNGVLITDALNMKSLTNNYSEEEIYEYGINASIDMFLMPNGIERTIDIIENLVVNGKVLESQIDKAVLRILKLKNKYLTDFTNLDESYFGSLEHRNILNKFTN